MRFLSIADVAGGSAGEQCCYTHARGGIGYLKVFISLVGLTLWSQLDSLVYEEPHRVGVSRTFPIVIVGTYRGGNFSRLLFLAIGGGRTVSQIL